jgi:hypothetical protein
MAEAVMVVVVVVVLLLRLPRPPLKRLRSIDRCDDDDVVGRWDPMAVATPERRKSIVVVVIVVVTVVKIDCKYGM